MLLINTSTRKRRNAFVCPLFYLGLILCMRPPAMASPPNLSAVSLDDAYSTDTTGAPPPFGVLFYNVENLFDTLDDAHFLDEEYTPSGTKGYSSLRYRLRIRQIARALRMSIAASSAAPLAVFLAEVENHGVLLDLARHPALQGPNLRWEAISFDSPDRRGIDCAALVNTALTTVLDQDLIRYSNDTLLTRDALRLDLRHPTDSTTLRLVGLHLSSKLGGARSSEKKRVFELGCVGRALDTLRQLQTAHLEILLGDFNEGRTNDAYQRALSAGWKEPQWRPTLRGVEGTYKYQGRWDQIDWALYQGNQTPEAQILAPAPLVTEDVKWGGKKPVRAWQGSFFMNGYSDHLPICVFIP